MLFAIVTNDRQEASIGFALACMRLQVAMATCTDTRVDMRTFGSLDEALNAFAKSEHDRAFFCNTRVAFAPEFALSDGADFAVARYPLPGVDWEAVKRDGGVDPRAASIVWNVDPAPDDDAAVGALRELGAFVLSRKAIRTIAGNSAPHSEGWAIHVPGVRGRDNSPNDADAELLAKWGGPVRLDTRPCGNFGSQEFLGCLSGRSRLR